MATNDYICLSCGVHHKVEQPAAGAEKATCPHCDSTNLLRLDLANLFGFTGGG